MLPPSARTRRPSRRPISALLTIAMVTLVSAAIGFPGSPAGATTIDYAGTTAGQESTIVIHKGDAYQRTIHPTGTVTARLDDSANRVTSANVTFEPAFTETFPGPFGIKVYASAAISQIAPASGTTAPGGDDISTVAVDTKVRMALTAYRTLDGTQHPATDQKLSDPVKCTVDISLHLVGTANRRTGVLSLAADQFTIPTFPNGSIDPAKTCGVATGELNKSVAGTSNTAALIFNGGPTSAHYTGISTGTASTVVVKRGTMLERVLHPTSSMTGDIDFVHGQVTNVSVRFRPLTIRALPGILRFLPVDARIQMSLVGTPTATLTPSNRVGIDNLTVISTARMGVGLSALGMALTDSNACHVDIRLQLTGTVDRGTNTVHLAQSGFAIPAFPINGCGILFAPALTMLVSGSMNTIALDYVDGVLP